MINRLKCWDPKATSLITTAQRKSEENKRLIKLLTPKSAVVIVIELFAPENFNFSIAKNQDTDSYVAQVTIKERRYEGNGISAPEAKQDVAEEALRELFTRQMGNNDNSDDNNVGELPFFWLRLQSSNCSKNGEKKVPKLNKKRKQTNQHEISR